MLRIYNAFFFSLAAIRFGWKNEPALRQEMILFLIAVPAAFFLTSNPWKILALLGSLLLLLAVEFLNTGVEKVADRVTLEHNPLIGIAKDCGSAAVLVVILICLATWSLAIWEWYAV